jgi:hypothetical protein
MTISINKLNAALTTIASFFEEIETVTGKDGTQEQVNRLGYLQQRILNGICYAAANAHDYTARASLPKAQDAARLAIRNDNGTELSMLEVNRRLDWVEQLNMQLAHLAAFQAAAEGTFKAATGKEFAFAPPRGVKNQDVAAKTYLDRAKALGLDTNVADDTNSTVAA